MHLYSCYKNRNLNLHGLINNKYFSDKFLILKFLCSELEQFYSSSSSSSEKSFFHVQVRVLQNSRVFSSSRSSLSLQPFPVLGLERVCPRKVCPWPWPRIFFVYLASSLVSLIKPVLSSIILFFSSAARSSFLWNSLRSAITRTLLRRMLSNTKYWTSTCH